jgi:hypothetical protein
VISVAPQINYRYATRAGSIVVTAISLREFDGDGIMIFSLLDRFLRHAQPLIIEGDSYHSARYDREWKVVPVGQIVAIIQATVAIRTSL